MIRALNTREKKKLLEVLGIHHKIPYAILEEENRYYLMSPDLGKIDLAGLNVKALGLMFARKWKGKVEMDNRALFLLMNEKPLS